MTAPVAIQAPICDVDTIELGRQSRLFRKQVLKVGKIHYKGRDLDFTPDYLDQLALAHREGVYDAVPLVFAGADNAHTQDVERIRGDVLGFERNGDSLDALVLASNDEAARQLRENPKIGVSVRIEQPIERADGRTWPAAIQHVLVTANPRVTGMAPWQPVDLARAAAGLLIDLSLYDFADDAAPEASAAGDPTPTEKEHEMADAPSFTPEETARLRALLDSIDTAEQGAQGSQDDQGGYTMPTDEQLAEIAAGLFDDDLTDADRAAAEQEMAGAALSAVDTEALELAQQRLDAQAVELAQIRAERDAERYKGLVAQLAESGIPPYITELARPLLLGQHVVELSNGNTVDATKVVREVLLAVGKHLALIDLSGPAVYDTPASDAARASEKARADEVANYAREFGLLG